MSLDSLQRATDYGVAVVGSHSKVPGAHFYAQTPIEGDGSELTFSVFDYYRPERLVFGKVFHARVARSRSSQIVMAVAYLFGPLLYMQLLLTRRPCKPQETNAMSLAPPAASNSHASHIERPHALSPQPSTTVTRLRVGQLG